MAATNQQRLAFRYGAVVAFAVALSLLSVFGSKQAGPNRYLREDHSFTSAARQDDRSIQGSEMKIVSTVTPNESEVGATEAVQEPERSDSPLLKAVTSALISMKENKGLEDEKTGIDPISLMPKSTTLLNGTLLMLHDIDLDMPAMCGSNKCAYRSKHDRATGYLLSRSDVARHDVYDYAQSLSKKYGIDHPLTEPPSLYEFTVDDAIALQTRRVRSRDDERLSSHACDAFPNCPSEPFFANVQPIRYLDSSQGVFVTNDKDVIKYRVYRMVHDAHKEGFYITHGRPEQKLGEQIKMSKKMMSEESCLGKVAKMFVIKDGGIVHLDLDRCREYGETTEEKDSILDSLEHRFKAGLFYAELDLGSFMRKEVKDTEAGDQEGSVLNGTELAERIDIDFYVSCGYYKCAYRDAKNASVGYLAGFSTDTGVTAERTYQFTMDAEREFGLQHTLDGPPRRYRFTANDAERLKQNHTSGYYAKRACSTFPHCFAEDFTATIQQVRFLDMTKAVHIKSSRDAKEKVTKMFRSAITSSPFNRTDILSTLADHAARANRFLHRHPSFWYDFQLIANLDGSITHLDYDRGFSHKPYHKSRLLDELPRAYRSALDSLSSEQVTE